jgi:hypothetical protein
MTAYLPSLSFPWQAAEGRHQRALRRIIAVQAGRAAHRGFVFVS